MKLPLLLIIYSLVHVSLASPKSPYFPGYGFSWYDPVCAFACQKAISSAPLACTTEGEGHHSHGSGLTSPECYAGDSAYLTTVAYCMNSTCDPIMVPNWQRETFWATKLIEDAIALPKWDYSTALGEVSARPTVEFNASSEEILNQTVLVGEETYEMQSKFMVLFDYLEALQSKYIFVLITIGFGTPIFLTLVTRLPFMTGVFDKVNPYLVYPSLVGTYHLRPLPFLLGNAPTVGQFLYVAMFFILNVILSAVNYSSSQPHPWHAGPRDEMLLYIGYRTGHIAFALLPLLIFFSGRNNFLLWITNWSYATYILLHRWIARIFALQAIVHSVTLLVSYKGSGSYSAESTEPYWLWGIVATVLTCAMLIFSHLYFRRLSYEAFLIFHILFAVFVIVGCWYHVVLRFGFNFYDNWLYAACAVWFFDRLLRLLRVAKHGVRRANITEIGPDHVRVDLPDVRWASKPGYVAYAYFPTLNPLRPWENHPFSVNSTSLFRNYRSALRSLSASSGPSSSDDESRDVEKTKTTAYVSEPRVVYDASVGVGTTGLTFIIKKGTGLTRLLKTHGRLMTLLDGPYPQTPYSDVLKCDHVLLIGGGIGITGLIAWTNAHRNIKLAWSVKASGKALVEETKMALRDVADKEVVVGERLDLQALLRTEAQAGYGKVGVVVCGPGGMCDTVRTLVAGLGRSEKTVFELEIHSFSW